MSRPNALPTARDLIYIGAILLTAGASIGVTHAQVSDIKEDTAAMQRRIVNLNERTTRIVAMSATLESMDQRLERIETLLDRRYRK